MNTHQFVAYASRHFVDTHTVEAVIASSKGRAFFIKFLKRDGEVREGTFRLGVKAPVIAARAERKRKAEERMDAAMAQLDAIYAALETDQDEERTRPRRVALCGEYLEARNEAATADENREPYEPQTHDLIRVYDMDKRAYRMIPTECVLEIRSRGLCFLPERTKVHKRAHVRTRLAA